MTNYNDITDKLTAAIRSRSAFIYKGTAYDVCERPIRIAVIDRISTDYARDCSEEGRNLDATLLERLADAIMFEELTNTWRGKSSLVEYPVLSERQLMTRHNRERSIKLAEETGLDGQNHAKPRRRKRSKYENEVVDSRTLSRNKERAAQYRKDTAAGRCVTYTGGTLSPEFVTCRGLGERWRNELSVP